MRGGRLVGLVCWGVLLCMLSACYRDSMRNSISKKPVSSTLFEARYADLPLPIGSTISSIVMPEDSSSKQAFCAYSIAKTGDYLCKFYQKEMEFWGWNLLLSSHIENKYILVFQKPGKRCLAIHIVETVLKLRKHATTIISDVSLFLQ